MKDQLEIWSSLVDGPQSVQRLRRVIERVLRDLSAVTRRPIIGREPSVWRATLARVNERAGGVNPEEEMVGVYLIITGGLQGQALIILPKRSALSLANILMGEQAEPTDELGALERSALAELGNQTLAAFLNGVASLDDMPELLRPSPPAVVVDMLGAILDVILTPVAAVRDDLLIIETAFQDSTAEVQGRLWVLPDPTLLNLADHLTVSEGG